MTDAEVPSEALAILERVARAIRDELGEEIEAYPGHQSPEGAEPLNRAFRAVGRSLLLAAGAPVEALAASVSRMLLRAASRRLEAEGWDILQIRTLIELEPDSPDDWLAFLILADRTQVEPLLGPESA